MKNKPPFSKETEQALIACMMLDNKAAVKGRADVTVQHFYEPKHQIIAEAIYNRLARNEPTDVVSVMGAMTDEGLEKAGGVEYISSLVDIIPSVDSVDHYIKRVIELWQYRTMIQIGAEMQERAYNQTDNVSLIAADMERKVIDCTQSKAGVYGLMDYADVLQERFQKFTSKELVGYRIGHRQLDGYLSGIQPGLIVISGRPGMGKTSFSMWIAAMLSLHGAKGLMCQFDGGLEGYMEKLLCQIGGFTKFDLAFGKVDQTVYGEAMCRMHQLNLKFMSERINAYALRAKVQAMRDQIDFLVVDQLPTMPAINDKDDEVKRISRNVVELKAMAVDMQLPIIMLAQINRGVEGRSDKRPVISDLKGSGAIEEEADAIMLLYRDAYYNDKTEDVDTIEVDLCKNKYTEITPPPMKLKNGEGKNINWEVAAC